MLPLLATARARRLIFWHFDHRQCPWLGGQSSGHRYNTIERFWGSHEKSPSPSTQVVLVALLLQLGPSDYAAFGVPTPRSVVVCQFVEDSRENSKAFRPCGKVSGVLCCAVHFLLPAVGLPPLISLAGCACFPYLRWQT